MADATQSALEVRLIARAREYATERGWPWIDPSRVELTRVSPDRLWMIRSNALAIGMNVRVVVREEDLTVVDAGYLTR